MSRNITSVTTTTYTSVRFSCTVEGCSKGATFNTADKHLKESRETVLAIALNSAEAAGWKVRNVFAEKCPAHE